MSTASCTSKKVVINVNFLIPAITKVIKNAMELCSITSKLTNNSALNHETIFREGCFQEKSDIHKNLRSKLFNNTLIQILLLQDTGFSCSLVLSSSLHDQLPSNWFLEFVSFCLEPKQGRILTLDCFDSDVALLDILKEKEAAVYVSPEDNSEDPLWFPPCQTINLEKNLRLQTWALLILRPNFAQEQKEAREQLRRYRLEAVPTENVVTNPQTLKYWEMSSFWPPIIPGPE